ncbi:MAG: hypothetical protein WKF43_15330 [Acidimicrobiales bacterium]
MADDVAALLDALDLERPVVAGYATVPRWRSSSGLRHPGRSAGSGARRAGERADADLCRGVAQLGLHRPRRVDLDRIAAEFGDDMASMRAAHVHVASRDQWECFLRQIADL